MPLNVACIIPTLNSCDYGGVGVVICGYDGDENDDDLDYDDDAGDDNYFNQDHDHNDEGTSSS